MPNCESLHTPQPDGYMEWHAWADKMGKTHKQTRCPECGKWKIWARKKKRRNSGAITMIYPKERYGAEGNWFIGTLYRPADCAEEVYVDMAYTRQCKRKKGHGKDGLFCKQHAKQHPEK